MSIITPSYLFSISYAGLKLGKEPRIMEPITIMVATLAAKWVAEGIVKEAAKSTWRGLRSVHEAVRTNCAADEESAAVLQRLEQDPTSMARTQALAEVLDHRLKADPAFAEQVSRLVDEAGSQQATAAFVTEVMENAKMGKITNIGTIDGETGVKQHD